MTTDVPNALLKSCQLCPRCCGANRLAGETGFCGAKKEVKVARASLHHWEEPCLSGDRGSGTVFFSYCTMRCLYCQNALYDGSKGKDLSPAQLGEVFLDLQKQAAHNINLVTPNHYLPQILEALRFARRKGLTIPAVYNTGGYETAAAIRLLEGEVSIFLPDLKYYNDTYAQRYSGVSTYFAYAASSIEEMVRQTGPAVFDQNGMLQKCVIVRHLVLPGLEEDSKKVIAYLYKTFGDDIYISIMNQYTPLARVQNHPELGRLVDPEAYERIVDFALALGVENGFIQEEGAIGESFIPDF